MVVNNTYILLLTFTNHPFFVIIVFHIIIIMFRVIITLTLLITFTIHSFFVIIHIISYYYYYYYISSKNKFSPNRNSQTVGFENFLRGFGHRIGRARVKNNLRRGCRKAAGRILLKTRTHEICTKQFQFVKETGVIRRAALSYTSDARSIIILILFHKFCEIPGERAT